MAPRRDGIPTLVSEEGTATRLERITFGDREIDEGWLQDLMYRSPDVLPINDLDPGFGPLIPIGREIGTAVGPIDNLYISPSGLLTIVEAKLWRNPQARREVVGQIIDYAKEVSRWGYEHLDKATRAAARKGLWELVNQSAEPVLTEVQFVDSVARNLRAGRFLLLIVGDGIREEMERMAEFLQESPQLRFSLALIELQVYRLPASKDLLTMPVIVGRTKEISRAIVRVTGDTGANVNVTVDIIDPDPDPTVTRRRMLTHQEFFQGLADTGASPAAVGIAQRLHDDFEADERFTVDWKSASFSLKLRDPIDSGVLYTVLVVERAGSVYIGWLHGQLERVGLPVSVAHEFAQATATLVGRNLGKYPDSWDRSVPLEVISGVYDEFKARVEELAGAIYRRRLNAEA